LTFLAPKKWNRPLQDGLAQQGDQTTLLDMSRKPRIPPELKERPFSLKEAREAGQTPTSLKGRAWRRLGTALYSWRDLPEDPWQVLSAWQALLPADAIFGGETAAWITGLDFKPTDPVEVVVAPHSGIRSRSGLHVRRCGITSREVVTIRGLRTTTLHRTLRDLCLRWPAVEVLVAIDMALRKGLTNATELGRHEGGRRLRSIAAIAAPAESPMETRVRWLVINAPCARPAQRGLPRPEVQTNPYDVMIQSRR